MTDLGTFCFRNSTDDPVNGLHVIFSADHAGMSEGKITAGPAGRITVADGQVDVILDAPLAPGMRLCFSVSGEEGPINVQNAMWSCNFSIVGTAEAIPPG